MTAGKRRPASDVLVLTLGTCLLFFDFGLYSLFVVQIAATFFPPAEFSKGLLLAFAAFSLSFLTRPIGAWLFGRRADLYQRSSALSLSFFFMGGGSLIIAITPGYESIGPAAPLLLILSRLAQGLAVGGEPGAAIALMVEIAPKGRRGLYASAFFAGQAAALVMGGLLGFLVQTLMSAEALAEYGWRVCFLLSALIAPFGAYLRRRLHEPARPLEGGSPTSRFKINEFAALGMMLGIGATLSQYLVSYTTALLQENVGISFSYSLVPIVILGLIGILGCIAGGLLADRYGLRRASLAPRVAFLLLVPTFVAVHIQMPVFVVTAIALLLAVTHFLALGVTGFLMAVKVDRSQRATTVGVVYAVAVTLFGGTAHLAFTALIELTGWLLSPLIYVGLANLLSIYAAHRITAASRLPEL